MKPLPGKEKQWTAIPWIAGAKPEETNKVAALKPTAFLLYLLWASLGASFFFCFFLVLMEKPVLKGEVYRISVCVYVCIYTYMNANNILLKHQTSCEVLNGYCLKRNPNFLGKMTMFYGLG